MGWTITNWTTNPDWAALANVNDFIVAVLERWPITGLPAPFALKSVGDDVQATSFFAGLQGAVESLFPHFTVSHDAGVERAAGYWDGKAWPGGSPAVYPSLAALFSAAGLATATWRAYTTHPDDAGVDQARTCQAGDIIGPWLFEDLQKCLKVLDRTHSACDYSGIADNRKFGVTSHPWDSWAGARTEAEADYNDHVYSDAGCYAYYSGSENEDEFYEAQVERGKDRMQVAAGFALARDIEWYAAGDVHADTGIEEWDDNGDLPDHAANTWHLWLTDEDVPSGAAVSSAIFGSLTMPTVCTTPVFGNGNPVLHGYGLIDTVAVSKWAFEYV